MVTTPILAVLGAEGSGGGDSDSNGITNITIWNEPNDTEEIDIFGNFSDPTSGHVPYHKRLETYLAPFLFAVIFIVGVIGR